LRKWGNAVPLDPNFIKLTALDSIPNLPDYLPWPLFQSLFGEDKAITVVVPAMEFLFSAFELDDKHFEFSPVDPVQQIVEKGRFPGFQKTGDHINWYDHDVIPH
jgi:hypothetical protein